MARFVLISSLLVLDAAACELLARRRFWCCLRRASHGQLLGGVPLLRPALVPGQWAMTFGRRRFLEFLWDRLNSGLLPAELFDSDFSLCLVELLILVVMTEMMNWLQLCCRRRFRSAFRLRHGSLIQFLGKGRRCRSLHLCRRLDLLCFGCFLPYLHVAVAELDSLPLLLLFSLQRVLRQREAVRPISLAGALGFHPAVFSVFGLVLILINDDWIDE